MLWYDVPGPKLTHPDSFLIDPRCGIPILETKGRGTARAGAAGGQQEPTGPRDPPTAFQSQ